MSQTTNNIHQPPLDVEHFRLNPADREANRLASICPACGLGILAVMRDMQTLRIREYDRCLLCGQAVRYLDVADLRAKDWVPETDHESA